MKRFLLNCWRVLLMPVSLMLGVTMFFWIALVNLGFGEARKFWKDWVL